MGLDIRKTIGRRASNAAASISDLQRLFSRVIATTPQTSQTIDSSLGVTGDLTFTEGVLSPATSSTYSVKSKQVVHTCTAAATNVIAINIPVGARIIGASAVVSTALVFAGGGASATLAWTTSGGNVATSLAAKNTKGSALWNTTVNPVVSGSDKTMTLTPNAGTIDVGGVIVVTAWYEELTDLTDVA